MVRSVAFKTEQRSSDRREGEVVVRRFGDFDFQVVHAAWFPREEGAQSVGVWLFGGHMVTRDELVKPSSVVRRLFRNASIVGYPRFCVSQARCARGVSWRSVVVVVCLGGLWLRHSVAVVVCLDLLRLTPLQFFSGVSHVLAHSDVVADLYHQQLALGH
ncbi:hypothetical protein Taro_013053, partial [Colocasia esculenta]|nr:hypothetical protein [Colocasia esculenta]